MNATSFYIGSMIALLGACASMQLRGQTQWHRAEIALNPNADPFAVGRNGYLFAAAGNALARSTDGGATWSYVLAARNIGTVSAIDIDEHGAIVVGGGLTAHRSTNDGESWSALPKLPNGTGSIQSLAVGRSGALACGTDGGNLMHLPANGAAWEKTLAFSGLVTVTADSAGTLFAYRYMEPLHYSTDGGAHWMRRGGLPIGILSIHAYSDGKLVACGDGGVCRSNDGGQSWSAPVLLDKGPVERVVAHPSGVLIALTATNGMFRSTDGGTSWTPPQTPIKAGRSEHPYNAPPPHLTVGPGGDIICGGSAEGIIRSTDAGATWAALGIRLGSFSISQIVRDQSRGLLYANAGRTIMGLGTGSTALLRSSDDGEHWEMVSPSTGSQLMIAPDGRLYMVKDGRIYASEDQGEHWGSGLPLSEGSVAYIAVAPNGMMAIEKTEAVYYRAYDGSWERQGNGPQSEILANARGVFVAHNGQRSTDNGKTWLASTGAFDQMVADPDGTFYGLRGTLVFRSADDGASWAPLPKGYAVDYSSTLALAPDRGLHITSTKGEIYRYDAVADRWEPQGGPLPDEASARAMAILPGSKFLMGTSSTGIYIGTVTSAAPSSEAPENGVIILSSMPQPASGRAEIRFSIAGAGPATLSLHDMTGRPIATIIDGHRAAGAQNASFDAGGLPGGVYVLRLTAQGTSTHSKFVVAR